jgi:hypothetical protein
MASMIANIWDVSTSYADEDVRAPSNAKAIARALARVVDPANVALA